MKLTKNILISILLCLKTVLNEFLEGEKLLFVFTTFRHGARAIYDNLDEKTGLDMFKEKWDYLQELTPSGMRMHYLLGSQNRKKYSKYNFLNNINRDKDLLILSTSSTRTVQSVNSFLKGLLPDGTGKILTSKQIKDNIFKPPVEIENYEEILKNLGDSALPNKSHYYNIKNFNEHINYINLQYMCKHFGEYAKKEVDKKMIEEARNKMMKKYGNNLVKILNLPDISKLTESLLHSTGDTYISDYTDERMLQSILDLGIDKDEMYKDYIEMVQTEMLNDGYLDNGKKYLARLSSSKIFRDIINNMKDVINSETINELSFNKDKVNLNYSSGHKLMIYSAHDDNLSTFSNFLQHALKTNLQYPHYASQLSIELYSYPSFGSNFSTFSWQEINSNLQIKIFFDGNEMYSDSYNSFINKIEMSSLSDREVDEFCMNDGDKERFMRSKTMITIYIIFIVLIGILILVMVFFIYKICNHKFEITDEIIV